MQKLSFIFSVAAFLASVAAICVAYEQFSLGEMAFLGWVVAVLSTLVLILIGWDIYKVVEINRRLDEKSRENNEVLDKVRSKLAHLEFFGSEKKTSLSNMEISKQVVYVAVSSNQSFSISSVSVMEQAFVVVVAALADITISLPTAGKYVNRKSAASLKTGETLEINVFQSSESGKYHLSIY